MWLTREDGARGRIREDVDNGIRGGTRETVSGVGIGRWVSDAGLGKAVSELTGAPHS